MTISALSITNTGVSVSIRQSLVMSVVLGEAHPLPAGLFSPKSVGKLISVVSGILPEKLFFSGRSDILLIFPAPIHVVDISNDLNYLSSWMAGLVWNYQIFG